MKKTTAHIFIMLVAAFTHVSAQPCKSGKLDPRVAGVLQYMPDRTLEQERAMPIADRRRLVPPDPNPVPMEKMRFIKVTADSIPVVVFRPDSAGEKPLPVVIEYHGGAFYLPLQPWMYHGSHELANQLGAIVFSVDYRAAPEHRFPAGVNDCYNAFKWLAGNAHLFGGDTSKIMLDGSSSGGNLAAVVSLLAKREGLEKKIKMMTLFCPDTDNPMTTDYPSYRENGTGYGISKNYAVWATENYSGNLARDTTDFRMFPIKADDFTGLPPTIIYTAEFDVLRDEGIAYADKLKAAGVPVLQRCFAGQLHVLMGLPGNSDEWGQISADARMFMKKYL